MTQTIYTVTYFHPQTTNGIEEKTFLEENASLKFFNLLVSHGYEAKRTYNPFIGEWTTPNFYKYKFVPVYADGKITCEWHKINKPQF